jgi:hypothetical protein
MLKSSFTFDIYNDMKSKQLDFGSFEQTQKVFKDFKKRTEHGHEVRVGQRKLSRPLDLAQALHLILRSELAKGLSLSGSEGEISRSVPDLFLQNILCLERNVVETSR